MKTYIRGYTLLNDLNSHDEQIKKDCLQEAIPDAERELHLDPADGSPCHSLYQRSIRTRNSYEYSSLIRNSMQLFSVPMCSTKQHRRD
jgi:hypothetical protein